MNIHCANLNLDSKVLVALLMVLAHTHSFQYGVVTPQDPFIFEGEPLRLYCNITNPRVRENSSSLFFERWQERRSSQMLNTRAIRLMVPHVTSTDQGSYVCLVRTMEGKEKVVGRQHVNVDVKPKQVENVTCRVYNWEEMTCTWNLGIRYRHPDNVNVSVFWVTTDVQQDCPWLSRNSCHWDREQFTQGLHYNIRIAVIYSVKGQIQAEASKMIQVNTQEMVEPAPVQELIAHATNSTCIMLTWEIPRVMYREKSFLQQIRTHGSKRWKDIASAPSAQINADHSLHNSLVCDLDRNSQYEFRVAVLPLNNGRQAGPTSDWKVASAYTEEDVPSGAPTICSGCFFDIPESEQDFLGSRKIRLMWKAIPKPLLHGSLTHYKISYWSLTSHYNNKVFSYGVDKTKPVTSVDLELPSTQEDYRVSIVGATRKGESRNASSIVIPAMRKRPVPPRRFLVKRNREEHVSGRLFLSWAALDTGHVSSRRSAPVTQRHASYRHTSGLTIVWCVGSRARWQCQGGVEWVHLPPAQVTYELNTNMTNVDYGDLLIGIAVEENDGHEVISSGIHWSTCVYTRNQKPKMAPQDVRFSPSATADSLVVTWRKPGCRQEPAYITEYLVRYCQSSTDNKCVGNRLTMNTSGEATGMTLAHLARNTKYLVYVQAVSSAGLGPPSDDIWHMVEPKSPEEDLSSLILIVVAIMCVLIVVTSCVCFIRCCYTKNQKLPAVDDLLEIQPTQKCPSAAHHHRDRPLPEPPSEAHIEHHNYGTGLCSTHACMKNHGYEEFQILPESEHLLIEGAHINRSLFLQNYKRLEPQAPEGQSQGLKDPSQSNNGENNVVERTSLLSSFDEMVTQSCDSAFSHTDKIQSASKNSFKESAQSYQRNGFTDRSSSLGRRKTSSFKFCSHNFQIPICFDGMRKTEYDMTKQGKIRLHTRLSEPPDFVPVSCDVNTPQNVKHTNNSDVPSREAVVHRSIIKPSLVNVSNCQTRQLLSKYFFTLSTSDQEFCTCDSNSGDSQTVDINDNVSAAYNSHPPPLVEKQCRFSTDVGFSLPSPCPNISPSPSPPLQPAPPVPIEEPSYQCSYRIQKNNSSTMNSSEYLEPRLISSAYSDAGIS